MFVHSWMLTDACSSFLISTLNVASISCCCCHMRLSALITMKALVSCWVVAQTNVVLLREIICFFLEHGVKYYNENLPRI